MPTSQGAQAAGPVDPLSEARKSLEHYDLDGTTTFAHLQALAVIAATDAEPARALEARFLRAAAAADLVVLAAKLERPALRESLARALACEPSALLATVKSELQAASIAHYKTPAKNALAMLDHVGDARTPAPLVGVLRDFNAIEAAAIAAKSYDSSAALALLSDDPCAKRSGEKLATACALASFDVNSRRSLAALSNAAGANISLQSEALNGDPLADALSARAGYHASMLDRVSVCVLPDIDSSAHSSIKPAVLPTSLRPIEGSSTLAIRVTAFDILTIAVPCVGLRSNTTAKPNEIAMSWSKLVLPSTYRSFVTPIAGLSEMLAKVTSASSPSRVVVMADAEVQAHVLARALVSLPATGADTRVSLLTRKPGGELQASLIEIARTETNAPNVRVRVRLGGYSLYVGDQFEDIPRVKTDAGFTFDRAALEQRLAMAQPGSAQISFMPDVSSDEVLAALSSTAARAQRVQIMIP